VAALLVVKLNMVVVSGIVAGAAVASLFYYGTTFNCICRTIIMLSMSI
jgi:hypothetical protein